ncbi:MAG: hypothetical protein J6Q15_02605, partial [Clostridia bacterium]|nr:hypothetical protein [Clostridia bacterium]
DINVSNFSVEDIEKFKVACRSELISKHKMKSEGFKGTANGMLNTGFGVPSQSAQRPVQTRPAQSRPAQPVQRPQTRPQSSKPQDNE